LAAVIEACGTARLDWISFSIFFRQKTSKEKNTIKKINFKKKKNIRNFSMLFERYIILKNNCYVSFFFHLIQKNCGKNYSKILKYK
jgi:hypothetical protein